MLEKVPIVVLLGLLSATVLFESAMSTGASLTGVTVSTNVSDTLSAPFVTVTVIVDVPD